MTKGEMLGFIFHHLASTYAYYFISVSIGRSTRLSGNPFSVKMQTIKPVSGKLYHIENSFND